MVRNVRQAPQAKAKDPREFVAPMALMAAMAMLAVLFVLLDVFGRR